MPELQLYEYAVIRVVPRVEREEFINVGIILFSKKTGFVQCLIAPSASKLNAIDPALDQPLVADHLKAFRAIALGERACKSGIARLDAASRFRWLTATRSTILQTAKVHPGQALDLEQETQRLLALLVL